MDYDGHKAKKEKSPKELMPNLLALELPSHVIVVKEGGASEMRSHLGVPFYQKPLSPLGDLHTKREREREIMFPHHLPLEYL